MTPDTRLIEATRAAFEDLLDESPLAPDWERVTGQIVPLRPSERRSRRTYAFAAAAVAAVGLIGASMILYGGQRDTAPEAEIVAPVAARDVCDLFTEEEVNEIVRDAYKAMGIPAAEAPALFVEAHTYRNSADWCDWNAAGNLWVILERIPDEEHKPRWSSDGFYQASPSGQFEPTEAMPSGVEVDYVRVRRGYGVTWEVGVAIQVVDDAPQWWRFGLWTSSDDPEHYLVAEDLAINVVSRMFETIQDDS
jgi:hypothetical protein